MVAQLTGYSALSSFTRWFVAEFGIPPGKWRRTNLARNRRHLQSPAANVSQNGSRDARGPRGKRVGTRVIVSLANIPAADLDPAAKLATWDRPSLLHNRCGMGRCL